MRSSADRPRRPKGLAKTGGRQRGVPNRKTIGLRMGLMAAGAPVEVVALPLRQQPLEFMLGAMNDASLPLEVRLNAARWAAPYVHAHKGQVDLNGISRPLLVQIIKFADLASEPARKTIEHDPQPSVSPTSH